MFFNDLLMQGSDFVAKAVDIGANELLAIATPGQGTLPFLAAFIFQREFKLHVLDDSFYIHLVT